MQKMPLRVLERIQVSDFHFFEVLGPPTIFHLTIKQVEDAGKEKNTRHFLVMFEVKPTFPKHFCVDFFQQAHKTGSPTFNYLRPRSFFFNWESLVQPPEVFEGACGSGFGYHRSSGGGDRGLVKVFWSRKSAKKKKGTDPE